MLVLRNWTRREIPHQKNLGGFLISWREFSLPFKILNCNLSCVYIGCRAEFRRQMQMHTILQLSRNTCLHSVFYIHGSNPSGKTVNGIQWTHCNLVHMMSVHLGLAISLQYTARLVTLSYCLCMQYAWYFFNSTDGTNSLFKMQENWFNDSSHFICSYLPHVD